MEQTGIVARLLLIGRAAGQPLGMVGQIAVQPEPAPDYAPPFGAIGQGLAIGLESF
jgi:hypothetical protein